MSTDQGTAAGPQEAARTSGAQVARRPRRLEALGRAIDPRLWSLQKAFLAGAPWARADLARLRRGLGKAPGAVPEIWEMTIGSIPPELAWNGDEPSRAEVAAHAAFTLYALHQQAFSRPAHVAGVGFGTAVRRLATGSAEAAVTRRFMAVSTAGSIEELLTHARGLITQLRGTGHGLDYAMLADDIHALITPNRENKVKLAWGRGFYHGAGDSRIDGPPAPTALNHPDTETDDPEDGEQA
ncbi:type I-E CRISPR-associated protein Cse2/CasB [Kribbella sp. NPDC059898]|uniref:type I-E CRISPR-associated protein Cse2/CasB n=1 Tax=Kribbella sp. NPDC059898 TaxID=3346995 RepID=UPI00365F5310